MNRSIPDHEDKLLRGGFIVAMQHVTRVEEDASADIVMADRARQVSIYIGGATLRQIGRDPAVMGSPRPYSSDDRDTAFDAVAARAAELLLQDLHTPNRAEGLDLKLDASIEDTILSLLKTDVISESMAKGMLVVFGEIDVKDFDPEIVKKLHAATTRVMRRRINGKQRHFPFVNKVVGNDTDGLTPQTVTELALDQRSISDYGKALTYVQTRISHELHDLYSPRQY